MGVIIPTGFLVALTLRRPLERYFILSRPDASQANHQLFLDFLLCLIAGLVIVAYLMAVYNIPAKNGLSVIIGYIVVGFFLSLDMALARERAVILEVLSRDTVMPPPKRLYSMVRKFSLVAFTTALFVSVIIIIVVTHDMVWLSKVGQNATMLSQAQRTIINEIFFIMAVLLAMIVNIIFSYSRNLKLLFENETGVLKRVSQGDLSRLVPVVTNDEFGVIAGHTNTMIHGLKHRIQLITSLKLAEEVQQSLLPLNPPDFSGLDVAGTSIYCDETGGDYYDYLKLPDGRLGVVVADASDHGVGAALYMATARAFLVSGASDFRGPAQLLEVVNLFLEKDSYDTGRFMTMFFIEIDPSAKTLRWVRAGHEPAILYDPVSDSFFELSGEGMALGVVHKLDFQEYTRQGWTTGSVIVVGTDGIRETRNIDGEMFGLDRLHEIIRNSASGSAETIKIEVIETLQSFQGDASQEDDITLVVIKLF